MDPEQAAGGWFLKPSTGVALKQSHHTLQFRSSFLGSHHSNTSFCSDAGGEGATYPAGTALLPAAQPQRLEQQSGPGTTWDNTKKVSD